MYMHIYIYIYVYICIYICICICIYIHIYIYIYVYILVSLNNNDKYTPVLNHKLKLLDGEMNIYYFDVVEVIDNLNFKISNNEERISNAEHFIYGYMVNDFKKFKKLSKDHFHAITISSVQELYRKIEQQQNQINRLLEIIARNNIS